MVCKFWLEPISLTRNHGFAAHELTVYLLRILEARDEHGDGHGVHWPDLDEDISAEGMLTGTPARPPKGRTRAHGGAV